MKRKFSWLTLAVALSAVVGVWVAVSPAGASPAASQIPLAGTGSPQTGAYTPSGDGDVTQAEFPGQEDEADGPGPYPGTIVNRSNSTGTGNGASVNSGKKAKSNPTFDTGFEGLNLYQQRYARGGNQFTVEPPDQGMCAGNGYVLEAVNDVLNVFSSSTGQSVLPDNTATNIVGGLPRNVNHAVDLNSFYNYAPAINRTTGARGPFLTDPSCLFDSQTQRWFVVVLTLETQPGGPCQNAYTCENHLDLAVSKTSDPTGQWNIYKIGVTNDGTNTGGVNPGPYLGDYPHIGADANGFYITTNAYPWHAQRLRRRADLRALEGAARRGRGERDDAAHRHVRHGQRAERRRLDAAGLHRLAGAVARHTSSHRTTADRVLHELERRRRGDASGGRHGRHLLVEPARRVDAHEHVVAQLVHAGAQPLEQGAGREPVRDPAQAEAARFGDGTGDRLSRRATASTTRRRRPSRGSAAGGCSSAPSRRTPRSSRRRTRTTPACSRSCTRTASCGARSTRRINPDGGPQRAGIAYFVVNPNAGKVVVQGYLGATGYDFTYPAIGVTESGRGVMAFTATGDTLNPSAAYAPIDANVGAGDWNVVPGGEGQAQDDGFTSYKSQVGNPPRTRWGDYGAAAVDGKSIWIASEYIAHACDYTTWGGPFFVGGTGDNLLGTCAGSPGGIGTRAALGNWSTRISKLTP